MPVASCRLVKAGDQITLLVRWQNRVGRKLLSAALGPRPCGRDTRMRFATNLVQFGRAHGFSRTAESGA